MGKPVEYFRCPACGSLRTRYYGGVFSDSYCEDCGTMFGEPDRFDAQLAELKAAIAESFHPVVKWIGRRLR